MKYGILILFQLGLVLLLSGQESDSVIKRIKHRYSDININKYDYKKVEKKSLENSGEGGSIIAYYSSNNLVLIIETNYYENGKDVTEFYFDNDEELIFIYEREGKYNAPFYDSTIYNPKKTKILENRFYFNKKRMIRWVNEKKQIIKKSSPNYKVIENNMLGYSVKLKNYFK